MCTEIYEIDAAAGADNSNKKAEDGPILNVDDPRFGIVDKAHPLFAEMQKRRKVLAVIANRFPSAVGKNGQIAPFDQGPFQSMVSNFGADGSQNSCTSVNAVLMMNELYCGASGSYGNAITANSLGAYQPYKKGLLPSVGDTFNMYLHGKFKHVGIFVQINLFEREFWMTADGGQSFPEFNEDGSRPPGQAEAAYLVPRMSSCKEVDGKHVMMMHHYGDKLKQGGYELAGWVNIGHKSIRFKNDAAYDETYGNEANFNELKTRIKKVEAEARKRFEKQWHDEDWATGTYQPRTL